MTGSITASTTIVFPFVVAFMGILNIPIESNKTNSMDTKDKKENYKDKKSKYTGANFLSLGQAATAGAMLLLIIHLLTLLPRQQ